MRPAMVPTEQQATPMLPGEGGETGASAGGRGLARIKVEDHRGSVQKHPL